MFLFAEADSANWIAELANPSSNVLNYIILLGVLFWLWVKFGVPLFKGRKETIEEAIAAARRADEEAKAFLQEQRVKVANAEKETASIVSDAEKVAQQMRIQIEEQTKKDIADMQAKIEAAIANERQIVITEMRAAAVQAALKLVEEQLKLSVSESTRAKLLNQFMEQLDSISSKESPLTSEILSPSVH